MIQKVKQAYNENFSGTPLLISSPGRINLIGEHTDYNMGFVLPAAIDKGIVVAIGLSDTDQTRIHALDMDQSIELKSLEGLKRSTYGWANYVLGVVEQLQKKGKSIPPFNCVFGGNIPIGSGLSSSAALENGIGFGLNELLNLDFSRDELLHLSQKAEHEFVGVKCGIMDQFASMMGQQGNALKLDCRSLDYQLYPVDFGAHKMVLFNSNVAHNLASSEYNVRRSQCEEGVDIVKKSYSQVQSLRDINMKMLHEHQDQLSAVVYKRCKYIIEENERVNAFVNALQSKDFNRCGSILFKAHEAMKTEYEITCPEIDILVDLAKKHEGVIGARMMGGGFGGCTLNLVHEDQMDHFIDHVREEYKASTQIDLSVYHVAAAEGVHLESNT